MRRKQRVLFFGEALTLSHVVRPFVLGAALPEATHEVHFATPRTALSPLDAWPKQMTHHDIRSLDGKEFLRRLEAGRPIYDEQTLTSQVREDLALLERIAPDVVVSDMRLSLPISARLAKIPLVTLANAYWHRTAPVSYTVPDIPIARWLGARAAQILFNLLHERVSARYAAPFNVAAQKFGLAQRYRDVRDVYTDGDAVLYADMAELVALDALPPEHRYLGPVLWSPDRPDVTAPSSADGAPLILASVGSSGQAAALRRVVEALAPAPVRLVVATAGRAELGEIPANVTVVPFLPLDRLLPQAALLICNGGSGSVYHALRYGVPVLGLASNLDQFLAIGCAERHGVGRGLRARECTSTELRQVTEQMLGDASLRERARGFMTSFSRYDAGAILEATIDDLTKRRREAA